MIKSNRKIAVLTYSQPHRKTYDLLSLLRAMGYKNIKILAVDFHYQKKFTPLVEHRPSNNFNLHPCELANHLGCSYEQYKALAEINYKELSDYLILIGGAGIIPNDFIENCKIINAHPAILPLVRGLDALKWSLFEDKPIGVTTHLIASEPDSGLLIDQQQIELLPFDNIQSIGLRLYELEIKMLVDSIEMLENAIQKGIYLEASRSEIHKRMPKDIEKQLIAKMIKYQENNLNITIQSMNS